MSEPAPRFIQVIRRDTQEVARSFDVSGHSDRQIERLIDGLSINMDHEKFAIHDTKWAAWNDEDMG